MSFIGLELAEMVGPPGVEEGEETGGEEDEEESRPGQPKGEKQEEINEKQSMRMSYT